MRQQIFVAFVRFLGVTHAGVLPHGPRAAAVHGRLHAAGIGKIAGISSLLAVAPAFEIGWCVERLHFDARGRLHRGIGAVFGIACGHCFFLLCARANEVTANHANITVKIARTAIRPAAACTRTSRTSAAPPITANTAKKKPVTSSQSTWPTRASDEATAPKARPQRLRTRTRVTPR